MSLSPQELRKTAYEIRQANLTMLHQAGMGHGGGDLSATDILTVLYFAVLDVDPHNPHRPDRDRFILSKGHAAGALYTTLAFAGFIPKDELATFLQPHSRLNGHPNRNYVPGVEANTGPLGHGLPIAVGAALAARMDAAQMDTATWRTFVLTGDGELQEGSNWEAAMAAAHFRLDNLTLIIDRNGLQQGDRTESTIHLEPLAEKWRTFGWSVREVDGHDHGELLKCFQQLPYESGKPNCIIAHTVKGKGVPFVENRPASHHFVPTAEELPLALEALRAAREVDRG